MFWDVVVLLEHDGLGGNMLSRRASSWPNSSKLSPNSKSYAQKRKGILKVRWGVASIEIAVLEAVMTLGGGFSTEGREGEGRRSYQGRHYHDYITLRQNRQERPGLDFA